MVDRLEKKYSGQVEFRIVDVEKDAEGPTLMQRFNARYVPTFVFIHSDGSVSNLSVGEQSQEQLEKQLDALR